MSCNPFLSIFIKEPSKSDWKLGQVVRRPFQFFSRVSSHQQRRFNSVATFCSEDGIMEGNTFFPPSMPFLPWLPSSFFLISLIYVPHPQFFKVIEKRRRWKKRAARGIKYKGHEYVLINISWLHSGTTLLSKQGFVKPKSDEESFGLRSSVSASFMLNTSYIEL